MSDMNGCPGTDLLAGWVEGSLSAAERSELAAHLAACDECRRAVVLASGLEVPASAAAMDEALLARLVAASRRRAAWPWAVAAAALLAVALGAWLTQEQGSPVVATNDPEKKSMVPPSPASTAAEAPKEPESVPAPPPVTLPVPAAPPSPVPAAGKTDDPAPPAPRAPDAPRDTATATATVPSKPGITEADTSNVFTAVFVTDPGGDLWIKRADAAPARLGVFERVGPKDRLLTRESGASFTLEGRASVVLEKGSEASVFYNKPDKAYALALEKGIAMVDTEGSPQSWHFSQGQSQLRFTGVKGRLSLEPRGGQICALVLDGQAELAGRQKVDPGREVTLSRDGKPVTTKSSDSKKKQARYAELRPKGLTVFIAAFEETKDAPQPFAYVVPSGRLVKEGPLGFLRAQPPEGLAQIGVTSEKVVLSATVQPQPSVLAATGMTIRFRCRTNCPEVMVRLGSHAAVYAPRVTAGTWAEAELRLEDFRHEGVPLIPSDPVVQVRFEGSIEKKAGVLEIDWVRFLRRAR